MKLPTETIDDIVIVKFPDKQLIGTNHRQFMAQMTPILDSTQKVVFDLSDLRFVDSSGIGSILSCLRKVQSDGLQMRICCVDEQVRNIFNLVRMERVANIDNTRQDALLALKN